MSAGDKAKIGFGTHRGAIGTVQGVRRRGRDTDLIIVSVPGVVNGAALVTRKIEKEEP